MQSDTHELARFGFSFERGGAHSSRTLMLGELVALLDYVREPESSRADYRKAIEESNCLGKRSVKTRALTYRHLVDLYGLDPSQAQFEQMPRHTLKTAQEVDVWIDEVKQQLHTALQKGPVVIR
jgi:hypothetical protein